MASVLSLQRQDNEQTIKIFDLDGPHHGQPLKQKISRSENTILNLLVAREKTFSFLSSFFFLNFFKLGYPAVYITITGLIPQDTFAHAYVVEAEIQI